MAAAAAATSANFVLEHVLLVWSTSCACSLSLRSVSPCSIGWLKAGCCVTQPAQSVLALVVVAFFAVFAAVVVVAARQLQACKTFSRKSRVIKMRFALQL